MPALPALCPTAGATADADGAALTGWDGCRVPSETMIARESGCNPLGDQTPNTLDRASVANPAHAIHCDRLNS
jgi:hypothetical protein